MGGGVREDDKETTRHNMQFTKNTLKQVLKKDPEGADFMIYIKIGNAIGYSLLKVN